MNITEEMIKAEVKNIQTLSLYGPSDFGRMLGWKRSKISTYNKRGLIPRPAAHIGGRRPVWTKNQILKYAQDNGIEIRG